MELKPDSLIELDVQKPDAVSSASVALPRITGLFKTVSTAPTQAPRSIYEQILLYKNGATLRLYVYDVSNHAWRFVALT